MKKVQVIISESHKMMKEQASILSSRFGEDAWERLNVPALGWTASEMAQILTNLPEDTVLVFASPLPLLLRDAVIQNRQVLVFHNDNREKKEVGPPHARKIVFTVAQTGWQLL